ncbi:MAG: hypothetical protein KAI22_03365 [Gammaproteobacteria bacterium]|nr:hypothetical protein [Gammaproteobacteria bacterium]
MLEHESYGNTCTCPPIGPLFYTEPELKTAGWRERLAVEDLICFDEWGNMDREGNEGLYQELSNIDSTI